ncbi:hypothetical protein [Glycomyces buryatensis]|uniref:Uncharacterized protein n=1 Tax=Glycomyces buryatensis TaxID=2570927 RepID=A0A4S8QBK1_9ACTN|nr:hypothetical protein [Glycomyces buryatensis]THV41877.1 hypothetical protein FAB82_09150 [Glycomyces buryatensis]
MSRVFDLDFVQGIADNIDSKVVPILEEANDESVLPALNGLDRALYTAVTLPLALSYSLATATVTESMAGAAEGFREMCEALDACIADMEEIDGVVASAFGGGAGAGMGPGGGAARRGGAGAARGGAAGGAAPDMGDLFATGDMFYQAGSAASPVYNAIIKTCGTVIVAPAIAFGPAVGIIASSIYMNQCNPGDMIKTGGSWFKLAGVNWAAADAPMAEVETITDDNWSGADAEAFKQKAAEFSYQLKELAINAVTLAMELLLMAGILTMYWGFLLTCTITMLSFFIQLCAVGWTGVGAAAVVTAANASAAIMNLNVKAIESQITMIAGICAGIAAAFSVVTISLQKSHGNDVGVGDILGGFAGNALEGLATFGVRALLMTPMGRHSMTALQGVGGSAVSLGSGWVLAGHLGQAASTWIPTYQGDGDWKWGAEGGGGVGGGVPDGLANWWQDDPSETWSNPDEVKWS